MVVWLDIVITVDADEAAPALVRAAAAAQPTEDAGAVVQGFGREIGDVGAERSAWRAKLVLGSTGLSKEAATSLDEWCV